MRLGNCEPYWGCLKYKIQEFKRWSGGGSRFYSGVKARGASLSEASSTPCAQSKQALWQVWYSKNVIFSAAFKYLQSRSLAGQKTAVEECPQLWEKVNLCSKSTGMKFFSSNISTWGCCSLHSSWHLPAQDFLQESGITLTRKSTTGRRNSRSLSAIRSGKMSVLSCHINSLRDYPWTGLSSIYLRSKFLLLLIIPWRCALRSSRTSARLNTAPPVRLNSMHWGKVIHSCVDFEISW